MTSRFTMPATLAAFSLACVLLASSAGQADDAVAPDLVFLLIGQSNMAGRAPLQPGDDEPIEGVLLLDDQGRWQPAASPLNRYASDRKVLSMQRIGPGDEFARQMRRRLKNQAIGLVVNARGGTAIEEWAKGKPLYDNTIQRLAGIDKSKIAGVLWHQGEANASDPAYPDKLAELIAALRKDLGRPELPFVAGQIFADRPVNKHIAALPDKAPFTGFASSEGLTVFDGVHFDRQSQATLGARYADAMMRLLELDKR